MLVFRRNFDQTVAHLMSDDDGFRRPSSSEPTKLDVRRNHKAKEIVGGRVAIVQFLGHGGMGAVCEASDRHLPGKHCALKMLRTEIAGNGWASRLGGSSRFQTRKCDARVFKLGW